MFRKKKGLRNKDIKKENRGRIKSHISEKDSEEVFTESGDYFDRKDLKDRQKHIYKGYIDRDRSKKEKKLLYIISFLSVVIMIFGSIVAMFFFGIV